MIFDCEGLTNLYLKLQCGDVYEPILIPNKEWIVTSTYTDKAVEYVCQIMIKEEGKLVAHTPKFYLYLKSSIPESHNVKETVPPVYKTEFERMVEQSMLNATKAEQSATQAKQSEANAKNSADTVASSSQKITENTEQITQLKQDLPKLAIKDKSSGNPCVISDSADWQMQCLNIYGESEQFTTTGKNLLHGTKRVQGYNIMGFINDLKPNTQYTYSNSGITDPKASFKLTAYNSQNKSEIDLTKGYIRNSKETFTTPENVSDYEELYLAGNYADAGKNCINNQFQVEEGAVSSPYEPYTGGKPSPSPEYPQEVISKTVSEIKITGKNLINVSNESVSDKNRDGNYTIKDGGVSFTTITSWGGDYIYFNKIDTSKIKELSFELENFSEPTTADTQGLKFLIRAYNKKGELIKDEAITTIETLKLAWNNYYKGYVFLKRYSSTITVQLRNDVDNIKVGICFLNDKMGVQVDARKIQVQFGKTSTPYEPYKEQTVTLSKPIMLRGIPIEENGNVTIDGKQYVSDEINSNIEYVNKVKRITLDGSEKWFTWGANTNGNIGFYYYPNTLENDSNIKGDRCISNCLPYSSGAYNGAKVGVNVITGGNATLTYIIVSLQQSELVDVSSNELAIKSFKEFLVNKKESGVPFEIYCQLLEPIITPLSESDQQAIKELKSYYPNTVIQTGAYTEATYVADPKLYIDKKLEPLNIIQSKLLEIESKV